MFQFIESICFADGVYHNLQMHQNRLNHVFEKHYSNMEPHDLSNSLPKLTYSEKYKVRVMYNIDTLEVEFVQYVPKQVQSIKVIIENEIDYAFKSLDRGHLNKLYQARGSHDDILIIKNNLVTDSYYANPIFWNGHEWIAPRSYLLNGTKRQKVIEDGLVKVEEVTMQDIWKYEKVSLINAMLDPGECQLQTENVHL